MKAKTQKQQLNVIPNPQYQVKQNKQTEKQSKIKKNQQKINQTNKQGISNSPNKKDELRRVQSQIQVMRNKVQLLKQQLNKQQQGIKVNKNKIQEVIKKKINVNKIQKYKQKDVSFDMERAEKLRQRNASLRQSHQSQMQNILKAIYLVKLDDARQIKNLSKSYQKSIQQSNDFILNQQLQKKKKVAEQSQKAKQKYEKYWKQKLASIYENQNKDNEQTQKNMSERKDELRRLREQQIQLLQNMNKVQEKQLQTKKQYLAALSLPVKDVAQALDRSKSSLQNSVSKFSKEDKLSRMNSELVKSKKSDSLLSNFSGISIFKDPLQRDFSRQKPKVPNSNVNKQKLTIILRQLKRLQKKEKSITGSNDQSDL